MLMRLLCAAIIFLIPAHYSIAAGVGGIGVSLIQDTDPDYILIVGDTQIGGNCVNRGWALNGTAEHIECGDAQVLQAEEVIRTAFARYPIDYGILVGDLIDNVNQVWERDDLAAMLAALPADIRTKLNVISGNHDSNGSTCVGLDNHLSQNYGVDGGIAKMYWSKSLRRTRIVAFSDSVSGGYYANPCHAQNDPAKYPSVRDPFGGFAAPACFGDDSVNPGASVSVGGACSSGLDCKSGACGIWEDYYQPQMDFISRQIGIFNSTPKEETLIVAAHQALCRDVAGLVTTNCANAYSADAFYKIQNMHVCDSGPDVGKYCNTEDGSNACVGGDAICVAARPGNFATRDDLLAMIQRVDPAKQGLAWASGHVGSSSQEPNVATDELTNGAGGVLPFLKAESVGVWANTLTDQQHGGLVIRVPHNGAPEIVAYIDPVNLQPSFSGGTVNLASTDSGTIIATDPDYGEVNFYVQSGGPMACTGGTLTLQNNVDGTGDLNAGPVGTITSNGCDVGLYGPYTICATDYLNGTGDGTTSPGLESCAEVLVSIN